MLHKVIRRPFSKLLGCHLFDQSDTKSNTFVSTRDFSHGHFPLSFQMRLGASLLLGVLLISQRSFLSAVGAWLLTPLAPAIVLFLCPLLAWFLLRLPPRDISVDKHYQLRGKTFGHRGCRVTGIPENSLEAFRHAKRQGVDGIELDLQVTKDREIIVFHDLSVERMLKGNGYVSDKTLAELRDLTYIDSPSEHVPTLQEALTFAKNENLKVLIEVKNFYLAADIRKKLFKTVKECGMNENIVYISFSPVALYQIRVCNPAAQTCLLYHELRDVVSDSMRKDSLLFHLYEKFEPCLTPFNSFYQLICKNFLFSFLRVSFVGPHQSFVSHDYVNSLERENVGVYSWVINSKTQKRWYLKIGVCVGTDYVFN